MKWLVCVPWLVVVITAGSAHAGTFQVKSCEASTSKRGSAWVATPRLGEPIEFGDWCASDQTQTDGEVDFASGRWLRMPIPPPTNTSSALLGLASSLTLSAPQGGQLVSLTYRRRLQTRDPSWQIRLRADTTLIEACVRQPGLFDCGQPGYTASVSATLSPGTKLLELGAWCVEVNCPYNPGPNLYDFAAVIYSSIVTIEENIAPTVSAPTVSGLVNGWAGVGSPTLALAGSDTLGLRRLELLDGDSVARDFPNAACVDWSVLPCSDATVPGLGPGFGANVDLASLSDGTHELRVRATDAAGNQATSSPVNVRVDRKAPTVGTSPGVATTAATAPLSWLPGNRAGSPLSNARITICSGSSAPTDCRTEVAPNEGQMTLELGSPGTITTAQVEISDDAGNVGRSAVVEFRRVATEPQADPPTTPIGTTPQTKRATKLVLTSPSKLRPRVTVIDVAGSVVRGSTRQVTVTVKGRPAGRKRNVTYRATAKPTKAGTWKARVKLPRNVSRRRGVLVTVTATPAAGFADATLSKRLRG